MEEKTDKKTFNFWEHLLTWAAKDFVIILLLMVCLLACLYTLETTELYQEKINQAWEDQWYLSGCKATYYVPNITFNLVGDYNENKD